MPLSLEPHIDCTFSLDCALMSTKPPLHPPMITMTQTYTRRLSKHIRCIVENATAKFQQLLSDHFTVKSTEFTSRGFKCDINYVDATTEPFITCANPYQYTCVPAFDNQSQPSSNVSTPRKFANTLSAKKKRKAATDVFNRDVIAGNGLVAEVVSSHGLVCMAGNASSKKRKHKHNNAIIDAIASTAS